MRIPDQAFGIILAGGRSSRFGQDKGLFPYQGKPLVEHAIDILRPNVSNLAISTNNHNVYALPAHDRRYLPRLRPHWRDI